jgi:hypothetical protein
MRVGASSFVLRGRLAALGALLGCICGVLTAGPAMAARSGSFSCRASTLRAQDANGQLPALEPITAGADQTTPAHESDPCRPQSAGLSDYKGPTGCLLNLQDPNCLKPTVTSIGLLYATTEECQRLHAVNDPQTTADDCGVKNLASQPVAEGDGVKARAGVADAFLSGGGMFAHISAVNAFASVRCVNGAPVFDARSQVVFINLNNQLGLDLIPGLIPNGDPTHNLNTHARLDGGALGTIDFNETLVDGVRQPGPTPTIPAGTHKITQRAIDIESPLGSLVVGEATVNVTGTPCQAENGHIVIRKRTIPHSSADFTFVGSDGIGTFRLEDDGDETDGEPSERRFDVTPGQFTVTEDRFAGFTLTSVVCSDPTNNSTGDLANRRANINVASGETVTCTFTNAENDQEACPPDDNGDENNGDDHHRGGNHGAKKSHAGKARHARHANAAHRKGKQDCDARKTRKTRKAKRSHR